MPEIVLYYLLYKAKPYMNELCEERGITILSQFIKLYVYKLYRKEKIANKCFFHYKLQKEEDSKLHIDHCNIHNLLFR